jgi:hypothetical protein
LAAMRVSEETSEGIRFNEPSWSVSPGKADGDKIASLVGTSVDGVFYNKKNLLEKFPVLFRRHDVKFPALKCR